MAKRKRKRVKKASNRATRRRKAAGGTSMPLTAIRAFAARFLAGWKDVSQALVVVSHRLKEINATLQGIDARAKHALILQFGDATATDRGELSPEEALARANAPAAPIDPRHNATTAEMGEGVCEDDEDEDHRLAGIDA